MISAAGEYFTSLVHGFLPFLRENWVVVSATLFAGGVARQTVIKVYNWRLGRKFKLSGKYATIYDHETESGSTETVYSHSKIQQSGKNLIINTAETDGRAWQQTAHIERDQYISGSYSSNNPFDTGVGTFFLKIEDHGRLVGSWHGFSHTHEKLRSGKYEFLKMERALHIVALEDRYVAGVLEISDNAFGVGYLSSDILRHSDSKVLVAVKNERIIGFSLMQVLPLQGLSTLCDSAEFRTSALDHADQSGFIGVIKTIAVDDQHRYAAIGLKLFARSEEYLFANKVTVIIVPVWQRKNPQSFENIAKIYEYSNFYEDPKYWEDDCGVKFKCIARKSETSCVCRCIFYKKTLRIVKKPLIKFSM